MKRALTLSWRRPLPYRSQSIDLLCKSMDWFLYDNGLRHEELNRSVYDFSEDGRKFMRNANDNVHNKYLIKKHVPV